MNADVDSYIYAKIEPSIPDFMKHETTFTLKFFNSNGELLTDFFNGEVQFIESYNYMNYEEWYETLGEPVPVTGGTATYTYTPTNEDIQFIGAQIIYDGKVVGLSTKCGRSANDFTALIELINSLPDNGVLNLSNDYRYGGENSRDREIREITIDKNITINGNGHLIIDAGEDFNYDDNTKGFFIEEGCTVVINDLKMQIYSPNANQGAAIYNKGNLTLNNCSISGRLIVFDDYEEEAVCGGAIYNDEGAVMTINSSNITGGIWGEDARPIPEGTTSYGGVIYNKGDLTITESDIRSHENSAPNFGGGIYNEGDMTITYSILCHNCAKIGNDIYHNGTSLYVSNSFMTSGESDLAPRNVFDFISNYGEYVLYAENTEDCVLNDIWWGTNSPDENTTTIELNNYVIFSLTAQNEIVENESNVFNVAFIKNGTDERVFACPHNTIIYFFIEKVSGKSEYVANSSLENGECHTDYVPVSGDYILSAGLVNDYSRYGKFDISDVRVELHLGLGAYNFSDLHNQIADADGMIELSGDYRYEGDSDSLYAGGVLIENKNIVIEGNGHTINGVGLAGALNVTDSNVTLRNVHFVNCRGGILALGTTNLTLINCTIEVEVPEGGEGEEEEEGGEEGEEEEDEFFISDDLFIDNGAHAYVERSDIGEISNKGSLTIESSLIAQIFSFDGSSVTVHNSIFNTYGDLSSIDFTGNVDYDLNGNYWGERPDVRLDIDNYLEMQSFTSFAPNVDVFNYFTMQFVYNGTDEVNPNVYFPVSFIKVFVEEIDEHEYTELICHSSISKGVARLEYTPDINTKEIDVIWGEIEDTNRFYMGRELKEFKIIPNEKSFLMKPESISIRMMKLFISM